VLDGWSPHGVAVYGVQLVDNPDELQRVAEELTSGVPSEYVVLRVSESETNVNRARSLRNLIKTEGYVSRAPSSGEIEALEVGRVRLRATEDDGLMSTV
jgi:hypothetical protein